MGAHGHLQQGWETEANVCLLLRLDPRGCSRGRGRWIEHALGWWWTHQAKMMQAHVGVIPCLEPRVVWDPVHGLQEGHRGSMQQARAHGKSMQDFQVGWKSAWKGEGAVLEGQSAYLTSDSP